MFGLAAITLSALPMSGSVSSPLGGSVLAQDQTAASSTPMVQPTPPGFDTAFDNLGPAAAQNSPANGAVDLDSFKPKRELPPPPPPKPKPKAKTASSSGKGRVIRSLGTKVASYYGKRFHGRLTANGERFNMNAMTAAHKTLPFGTKVRVTYPRNGRSIVVRINDRGPFIRGRAIDLSRGAAAKLGFISSGHARVKLDIVR
ncbi:MAG: septal ring lytic transglycosylase RlpA family protein [Erythrobacter sp.]